MCQFFFSGEKLQNPDILHQKLTLRKIDLADLVPI